MPDHSEIIRHYFRILTNPSDPELYDRVETVDEIVKTDPIEGWCIVRDLIEAAASEDELGYVAAGPLEDLLRLHGPLIASVIRRDAQHKQRVRDALSCVLLDPVPSEVESELGEWLLKLLK